MDDAKTFDNLAKSGTGAGETQKLVRALFVLLALLIVASLAFRRMLPPSRATISPPTNGGPTLMTVGALLLPFVIFTVFYLVILNSNKKAQRARPAFQNPSTIALDARAMTQNYGAFTNIVEWRGFTQVIASEEHLGLFTSATDGYVVPRRAFESDEQWQRFVTFARQQWEKTRPVVPPIANV